jgi:hypothetical protein
VRNITGEGEMSPSACPAGRVGAKFGESALPKPGCERTCHSLRQRRKTVDTAALLRQPVLPLGIPCSESPAIKGDYRPSESLRILLPVFEEIQQSMKAENTSITGR